MPLFIQFTRGSLAGRCFQPGPEGFRIGRSHSCGARPSEADVSGRHVSIMPAGETLAVTVESAHRTVADGVKRKAGDVFEAGPGCVVELGRTLAFRVVDGLQVASAPETDSRPTMAAETGTATGFPEIGTGAQLSGTPSGDEPGPVPETGVGTATFPGETDSGPTATVATGPGGGQGPDGCETIVFEAPTDSGGATGEMSEDSGETQVPDTMAASPEEIGRIKEEGRRKKARRTATRVALMAAAAGAALGLSLWMSMREPERELEKPDCRGSWRRLVPEFVPGETVTEDIPGFVAMEFPVTGSREEVREFSENGVDFRSFEVQTTIGAERDVGLSLVADVFRDPRALNESRETTLRRYLENSSEMHAALDNMVPFPNEDFFGGSLSGHAGLRRGVPCSRVGYWLTRGGGAVYGVVSFFRFGEVCCAFRREVPATEQLRAEWLLRNTRTWLFVEGDFAAAQWEGAPGAGCDDPKTLIERCQAAFDLDTPSEWPALEAGLRNVLVETASSDGAGDGLHGRALALLRDVRNRKALHWKNLVASRVPVAASGLRRDEDAAKALDAAARDSYPAPDEEWHFLARREKWWE